jgi:N-acetylglucosaminyldiphosphoundecaprenol N-acetyl-beta-D-mannosaminyltransferase
MAHHDLVPSLTPNETVGSDPAARDGTPRVDLMGLTLDALTFDGALERIRFALRRGRGGWLLTANLEHLRRYVQGTGEERALVEQADVVVADGMPLVWAARLKKQPLPERVAGSDLIVPLARLLAEEGAEVFFLGGNPGVADAAARDLQARHPTLRVAGTLFPPFGFERDPAALDVIRDAVVAARPRAIVCALPFPKQERLIAHLRPALPDAWFFGLGMSLSFVVGDVPRAPWWMQRSGLEWAHRLAQEPGRLARRYLVDGLPFAARLGAHAVLTRAR